MRPSAPHRTRIREHAKTTPTIVLSLTALSIFWFVTLAAAAQQGPSPSASTPSEHIALNDKIDRVKDAYAESATAPVESTAPADEIISQGVAPKTVLTTFLATAYCLKGQTASGVNVRRGIIAADPRILPLGSVVRLQAGKYSGIYTVMDTGGAIRGRRIDIYLPSRSEAIQFGSRPVKVEVLRHGWDPEPANGQAR